MMRLFNYIFISVAFLSVLSCNAMVFDNRFIPLIQYPYITVEGRPSHFAGSLFVATADRSFARNEEQVPLWEIFGPYDQRDVANSFVLIGKPNPLPSNFQVIEIPWTMTGKMQAQGFSFSYEQAFRRWFKMGFYSLAMHVDSSIEFACNSSVLNQTVTQDQLHELARLRSSMNAMLGLPFANSSESGFGDIDAYMRFGYDWDYVLKCRAIQAGLRFGMLAPTGKKRHLNNPASIPFGGGGFWGAYVSSDAEFELKEDWKVGFLVRVSKRFARTLKSRMPAGKEPQLFGAVVGPARIDPGVTAVASAYFDLENLREGFGVRVQYTWTDHQKDCWTDKRCNPTTPVNLSSVIEQSSWRSSYVTLNAFYDFGKVKTERGMQPILIFSWDVPVQFFDAFDVFKTNKVSLGLEFNF